MLKVSGKKLGEIEEWRRGNYQEFGVESFNTFFPTTDKLFWRERYVLYLFPRVQLPTTMIIPPLSNGLHLFYMARAV